MGRRGWKTNLIEILSFSFQVTRNSCLYKEAHPGDLSSDAINICLSNWLRTEVYLKLSTSTFPGFLRVSLYLAPLRGLYTLLADHKTLNKVTLFIIGTKDTILTWKTLYPGYKDFTNRSLGNLFKRNNLGADHALQTLWSDFEPQKPC